MVHVNFFCLHGKTFKHLHINCMSHVGVKWSFREMSKSFLEKKSTWISLLEFAGHNLESLFVVNGQCDCAEVLKFLR